MLKKLLRKWAMKILRKDIVYLSISTYVSDEMIAMTNDKVTLMEVTRHTIASKLSMNILEQSIIEERNDRGKMAREFRATIKILK